MDEPILLSVRQVAALLSVSPQKVRNLIADQRLRVIHIDRCVRVHREDLDTFVDGLRGIQIVPAGYPIPSGAIWQVFR